MSNAFLWVLQCVAPLGDGGQVFRGTGDELGQELPLPPFVDASRVGGHGSTSRGAPASHPRKAQAGQAVGVR
jgi:hypothetical protein